jgi:hypothetical protein
MRKITASTIVLLCASVVLAAACGGDDDDDGTGGAGGSGGSPDNTGKECETVDDCYPGIDHGSLSGDVECLDRVDDGYCTHQCTDDADCCAVDGECETELKQVCSPFESTGLMMCFLSCEDEDLAADGGTITDPEEYCQKNVSPDFVCRSSGGGANNRKVCVPGNCDVGEDCVDDTDCATGLTCVTGFTGGYCTEAGCTVNADCPTGSVCVDRGDENYCMKTCTVDSECSFCRAYSVAATCNADQTYVESTTTGSVCVPPS